MTRIDEFKEKLKEYEGQELKTSFLTRDLGISSYYIGVLAYRGAIEKKSKGIYIVKDLTKLDSSVNNFNNFKKLVLSEKYEDAYDVLIECLEAQNGNHDYDNHYRLYFILLTHILESTGAKRKPDYTYDDKLLEFYDQATTEYYESYLTFREAVLAKKFGEAYQYLQVYADKELAHHNYNKISTILCKKLLEEIVNIEENKKQSVLKLQQIYQLSRDKKFVELKTALEETIPVLNSRNVKCLAEYLVDLCQTVIDFQNDENLLLSDKKNYNFSGDVSLIGVFLTFLANKDYINAASYVEKCCSEYGGGLFEAARVMLNTLVHKNNFRYAKLKPRTEIQKMRATTIKSDVTSKRFFNLTLDALDVSDFDTAYEEIKKCLSYIEDQKTPVYNNTYNLYIALKFLKEMKDNKKVIESVNNAYFTFDSDHYNLKRAIRLEDWEAVKLYLAKVEIESSHTLKAIDKVLKEIFRQDRINRGIELTKEDELTELSNPSNSSSENNDVELGKVDGEKNVPLIDITKEIIEKEILERIKNLKLDYETLFNLIKNREFEEAYALILREEANGYSIVNEAAESEKSLLQDIVQNEKTEVVEEIVEPKEVLSMNEVLEEQLEVLKASEVTQEEELLSQKEKHKLEILESIKDIELNYDNLYELVCNQRYEEARYLIEREKENNNFSDRLTVNVHRLITQFQQIKNHTIKEVDQKEIDYSLDDFKIFYAALRNCDYDVAFQYVDYCIERASDKKEFELLRLILEDIVYEYNRVMKEKLQKEEENRIEKAKERQKKEDFARVVDINNELKDLTYKRELISDDVRNILSLLEQKVEIFRTYEKPFEDKDLMTLGVAEAAVSAENHDLSLDRFARIMINGSNKNYFGDNYSTDFSTDKIKVGDVFYEALKYGDLITAYEIIKTESWDNLCENISPASLLLIKHLLEFINARVPLKEKIEEELERKKEKVKIEKVSEETQKIIDEKIYEILSEEEKETDHYIALLKYLESAIENNHFTDALDKLIEMNVSFDDAEVDMAIFLALQKSIKDDSQALFDQFLKAEKSYNVEGALKALNNYRDYAKELFANYDIDYLYKRINTLKKDLSMRNYRDKEKVFENAHSLFNKGQYEKALGVINRYIAMDRYVNSKGFILKGDIYYQMNNYEKAKESYLKALTLGSDPTVCLKLGNIYFVDEDYEKAIYYLELYVQMEPFRDSSVSRMLTTCYESNQKGKKREYSQQS